MMSDPLSEQLVMSEHPPPESSPAPVRQQHLEQEQQQQRRQSYGVEDGSRPNSSTQVFKWHYYVEGKV